MCVCNMHYAVSYAYTKRESKTVIVCSYVDVCMSMIFMCAFVCVCVYSSVNTYIVA